MDNYSYVGNGDVNAVDHLYQQYKENPESLDISWRKFFEGFEFAKVDFENGGQPSENMHKEFKVINLIQAYRTRGHLFTKTNPVRTRRTYKPTLELEHFGLEEKDLNEKFQAGAEVGLKDATLKEIIAHLEEVYCQSIGIEFMYMREPDRLDWMKEKIEAMTARKFSKEEKQQILKKLTQATQFEQYLQKKFVGQKRFSVEGGEALIPALDALVERGSEKGVEEIVIGMAHRGRLNVLANIFNKDFAEIFSEFEGKDYEGDEDFDEQFDGDVKYHLGYSCDQLTDGGKKIHTTLAPNPSHLETVNPVVEGISRAKIDAYLKDEKKIIPVLIHGDAAIAGQGIVYEVVQMAGLDGYRTGGTIHIVVNNQVGFTTNYLDGRTSTYCTDVAKTTLSPVFHVNGDDVEAMVKTMELALEYRQKFGKDVFIDLLCYRKYGHNEGDEPKFTQPQLYKSIAKHPNPMDIYQKQLIAEGNLDKAGADSLVKDYLSKLDTKFDESKEKKYAVINNFLATTWKDYTYGTTEDILKAVDTKVDEKTLRELADKVNSLPEGKNYFRKIQKLYKDRVKMVEEDRLDWGTAETLAYASLLNEGHAVRISGQDVERGTFSHRHAVVKTEDTEEEIIPLNLISDKQAPLTIYNSLLSEYGVLGFDYGYALTSPNDLVIWEAQFGDFNNGAQIIIDQFLSAAEDKWKVSNGMVMLLPHGYEGMGSEHSSARMERFLSLCAHGNMQAANCTTPANFFHLLRRQLKRDFRKPLIVFTPKWLLRYAKAVSSMKELATGSFQELIPDTVAADKVKKVVFCQGKFYYELLERREEEGRDDVALVRIEQLYPLPIAQMEAEIAKYKNAKQVVWAQEEPENMGAWLHMLRFASHLKMDYAGRIESASPAAGSPAVHQKRHQKVINKVFE